MSKQFYAGMEVDQPCRVCKSETVHRIMTLVNGLPEKVICASCGSVHKYREPEVARVVGARSAVQGGAVIQRRPIAGRTQERSEGARPSNQFQSLMVTEQGGASAKPYSVAVAWKEGEWLDHPSFGLGRVQRKTGKKIEVLFQSGSKILLSS